MHFGLNMANGESFKTLTVIYGSLRLTCQSVAENLLNTLK
jgi:hypothetical protein